MFFSPLPNRHDIRLGSVIFHMGRSYIMCVKSSHIMCLCAECVLELRCLSQGSPESVFSPPQVCDLIDWGFHCQISANTHAVAIQTVHADVGRPALATLRSVWQTSRWHFFSSLSLCRRFFQTAHFYVEESSSPRVVANESIPIIPIPGKNKSPFMFFRVLPMQMLSVKEFGVTATVLVRLEASCRAVCVKVHQFPCDLAITTT